MPEWVEYPRGAGGLPIPALPRHLDPTFLSLSSSPRNAVFPVRRLIGRYRGPFQTASRESVGGHNGRGGRAHGREALAGTRGAPRSVQTSHYCFGATASRAARPRWAAPAPGLRPLRLISGDRDVDLAGAALGPRSLGPPPTAAPLGRLRVTRIQSSPSPTEARANTIRKCGQRPAASRACRPATRRTDASRRGHDHATLLSDGRSTVGILSGPPQHPPLRWQGPHTCPQGETPVDAWRAFDGVGFRGIVAPRAPWRDAWRDLWQHGSSRELPF